MELPPKLDINLKDIARRMIDDLNGKTKASVDDLNGKTEASVGVCGKPKASVACCRGTERYQFQCESVCDTDYIFIRRRTNKKLRKRWIWIRICHFSDRFPILIYQGVVEREERILRGFNLE